jgi:hypothetical protein
MTCSPTRTAWLLQSKTHCVVDPPPYPPPQGGRKIARAKLQAVNA